MSGLEPLIASGLTAAGKAAPAAVGRLAAAIGLKLAKSWTWRWRVARDVRRQTGSTFPDRRYRAWLKDVAERDLRRPIGEAGAELTVTLDEALSGDKSWSVRDDRHSAALKLVQATYLSAVALSEPGDAALLQETWAQARHDELLGHVAQKTSGRPLLSREDRGALLLTESSARRRRRLAALGVSEDRVTNALNLLNSNTPEIKPGNLLIVVGSFGAGKSELAEAWIRQRIGDYEDGSSLSVPVWLHASDLGHRPLEESLSHHAKLDEPCAIVVDGLDEVDGQVAARIVERVGVLVETNAQSVALLTSRHGVLPKSDEQQPWDGVTADQARLLIEAVSGTNHATWDWNPMLIESVRRPFFAIGAGVLLAEGARPSSQADLVRRLVELALAMPSSASVSVQDSELYQLLVQAAVALVTNGGTSDSLTFQERQKVRTTRLITGSDSCAEFTLPIFQQWFAAQALLSQNGLLTDAISGPRSFDRWRWSMSIAGLSAPTADAFDAFAQTILQANPGAAAWVLEQVSSARGWPNRNANQFVDPSTAGARILHATRTWINATGVLAAKLFPVRHPGQPISLRILVDGGTVGTVWDSIAPTTDTVTYLDGNSKVPHDGTWTVYEEGGAIQGHEWPWARQQDRVAKGMAKALESTYRLGPVGGIWHNESRYRLARVIANDRSFMFKPLDRLAIATAVDAILTGVDDPPNTQFSLDRELIDGADLVDLASWLRSLPDPFLFRSVPGPDQDPQTGWVWSVYSDAQLLRFVAEAYGQACTAYDEARSAAFLDFDWSMGTATPGQFGVVAAVDPGDHTDGLSGSPSLTMSVVPLSVVEAESTRFGESARFSSNRRSLVVARSSLGPLDDPDAEHDYFMSLTERGSISNLAPFGHRSVVRRVLDLTSHPRPATEIAFEWIWDDLQRVKLAHGARPMLR